MAQELDMIKRDPNDLNDHIKVTFEDVLGEPDGAHSMDCVWRLSYRCFSGGRSCCYAFLTLICGIPLALCWGCQFACETFTHVWQYTPMLKMLQLNCGCCQKLFHTMVSCILGPICETCALCFSKVTVSNSG